MTKEKSEKQRAFAMRDYIDFYFVSYYLHHLQIVSREWNDKDAIVIVIRLLNGYEVFLYAVVRFYRCIRKKYGTLNGCAPHTLQIFVYKRAYLVALNIVHNEK